MNRLLFPAIGLLSASIIACQLTIMQMLSQIQWSHFAYMVISVALLGFGASGTLLSLKGKWFLRRFDYMVPLLMLLTSFALNGVILVSSKLFVTFDAYLLFLQRSHINLLLTTYFTYFVPFFLGALALGLIYIRFSQNIGPLYFADLTGSGAGGLMMLGLVWVFPPAQLLPLIGLLPLTASLLIIKKAQLRYYLLPAAMIFGTSVYLFINPPALRISEYKDLSGTLNLPETRLVKEIISPYGMLQVVESKTLRYAPGLSLTYSGTIPFQDALFNNGNWFGPVMKSETDSLSFLDHTTSALPYNISIPTTVLVLNAGTGVHAIHALMNGAKHITEIEPNKIATKYINSKTNSLKKSSAFRQIEIYSRSFLLSDTSHYDLIILPNTETFGGSSGVDAIDEQYLFTSEAFGEMHDRLTGNGMIVATTWMDYPVRNPLKLLATFVEMHQQKSKFPAEKYLAVIRGWGTISFVLKKSPLTSLEIEQIRSFCHDMCFDPVLLPDISLDERTRYNQLQDESFFHYVDQILTPNRENLYQSYDFNIKPATDNKPYFSKFLRIKKISALVDQFGKGTVPFLEIGYLILLLTTVQITVTAIILILLPLLLIKWKGPLKGYTVLHFGGIGIGFMFVEIVLIQQFILYFGNAVYAAATVLSGMLLCAGAGSLTSSKLQSSNRYIVGIASLIMIFILIYLFFMPFVLKATIGLPFILKFLISVLLILPAAFFMGMPFPLGLRLLSEKNGSLVPWAWGINGCMSVISTALATLIAVEAGSDKVLLVAALAYGLSLLVNLLAETAKG
jgi:hypothetical protein